MSVSGRQAVTTAGEPPPVEAEITARVPCPDDVAEKLIRIAPPERATYLDTYFDRGGLLRRADYELRVREVRSDAGRSTLLTLKGAPVDAGSGSRTELETAVADAAAVRAHHHLHRRACGLSRSARARPLQRDRHPEHLRAHLADRGGPHALCRRCSAGRRLRRY